MFPAKPRRNFPPQVSPAAGIEPATTTTTHASVPPVVSALRDAGLIDPSPDGRAEALFGRTTTGGLDGVKRAGGLDDDDPETAGGVVRSVAAQKRFKKRPSAAVREAAG